MLLANNHFTVVVGIDIHFTTLPPFNPFHPYIGLVLDPMDYIPFIGGTVNVNGIKRGVSDTSGIIIPLVHIPLFTPPWVMTPIIGHESTNFFASQNVFADGSRFSPKGYMTMTCNDIGIPLSLQPGKKKFWKVVPTLFAPTSFMLPIPTGPTVNVGGPYVPDWGGMLKNLIMGFGFGAVLKYGAKAIKKGLSKKASKLMSGADDVIPEPKIPSKAPKKSKPPFKQNPKHDSDEFNKQLKDQQDAINNMKTKEWLQNRENFKNRDKADYNKKAKEARDNYRQQEAEKRAKDYMKNNPEASYDEAQKAAQQSMKGQAALHNPDGVAGGKVDQITGMGDSGVNSSIGSQWGHGRAQSIEDQIKLDYGIPPNTINDIPDDAMMNVDLF